MATVSVYVCVCVCVFDFCCWCGGCVVLLLVCVCVCVVLWFCAVGAFVFGCSGPNNPPPPTAEQRQQQATTFIQTHASVVGLRLTHTIDLRRHLLSHIVNIRGIGLDAASVSDTINIVFGTCVHHMLTCWDLLL